MRNSYAITCTAWARLREAYSGSAGIRARALQRMISLFVRPTVSLPKTISTSSFRAAPRSSCAAARASSDECDNSRSRALKATEYAVSASASSRLAHACADSRTSDAPAAMARASGWGKRFGRTRRSCVMPMVFMARAAAPTLPGCEGRSRTTRIRDSGPPVFILESGVQQRRSFEFPDEKMHPMLGIAVRAARRAGAIINRAARDVELLPVTRKRHNDFVTEVDKAAERAVIEILHRAYPDHAILAEESGASAGNAGESEYTWIIYPLDGTTNFIHGFPQYAVSVALRHKGLLAQAVIYDPTNNELFTATRGRGAYLNERRIRVSKRAQLNEALIGTGFPFRDLQSLDEYLAMFREFTLRTSGLRRAGAAALDIAYVAAGRLDGFWEMGLSPWDMAAGTLLIREAGGLVGTLDGGDYRQGGNIVAGSPRVFAALLASIAPFVPEDLKEGQQSLLRT